MSPSPTVIPMTAMTTLDVLARTLWAEARNQGRAGLEAVACVILTRAAHPRWWGRDVRSVCLAPRQFSCWNTDDPQYARIRGDMAAETLFPLARTVAEEAMAGRVPDRTGGADSYANLHVCNPVWIRGRTPTAIIGDHTFFRIVVDQARIPKPLATPSTPAAGPVVSPKVPSGRTQPASPLVFGSKELAPQDPATEALNAASLARARGQ